MAERLKMRKVLLGAAVFTCITFGAFAQSITERVVEKHLSALDLWVNSGANVKTIQSEVVENCGKLVMAKATTAEKVTFTTTERDEFHFRVDVCAKMTVNRAHPQPEFENPDIVKIICDGNNDLFKMLCQRSGIRK